MAQLVRQTSLLFITLALTAAPAPAQSPDDEPPLPPGLEDAASREPATDEPPLPAGLGEAASGPSDDEPRLPAGLEDESVPESAAEEPALPEGLGGESTGQQAGAPSAGQRPALWEWLDITGFWEIRGGVRTQRDSHERDASIGETRLELELEHAFSDKLTFKLTADFVYDQVLDRHKVDLERGRGWLDLREASVTFSPLSFMDVKIGRQVLTWGTGDLVFLNDLFPKDWQAFFIGRDVDYLKAPSDAIKISLFSDLVNLDIVYTPRFDADRFITGERISYYNPLLGARAGRNLIQSADRPADWFRDDEWATRVSKNIRGLELAAYGYWGRWKSPAGMKLRTLQATFPRLSVYGGSARTQIAGGIANAEVAYYDSREDRSGRNPFVDNSQMRFLVGYERQVPEITTDLTLGAQYYVEWMLDHDAYTRTLPPFMPAKDEVRHVLTFRVTKLLLNQNLTLSLFAFYSPSDHDAYLRPNVAYKIDDHWTAEVGSNVFFGQDPYTFFDQFGRNTNVYLGLRYGF